MPLVMMWDILSFNAHVFCFYILYKFQITDLKEALNGALNDQGVAADQQPSDWII